MNKIILIVGILFVSLLLVTGCGTKVQERDREGQPPSLPAEEGGSGESQPSGIPQPPPLPD